MLVRIKKLDDRATVPTYGTEYSAGADLYNLEGETVTIPAHSTHLIHTGISAEIPEGAPDNILMITRIILLSVSALFLIPQVYVGLKGIFIAKNPTSSKGHIVWAWILLGIDVLSLISPIIGFVNNGDTGNSIGTILSLLLEITIYIEYIKYATDVSKGK